MKNRIISILIVLMMLMSIMPSCALAQDAEVPKFVNIQFNSNAIKNYSSYTFSPDVTEYNIEFSKYSTSMLIIARTTEYDKDKYKATASYKDINGEEVSQSVSSNTMVMLRNMPFGTNKVEIKIEDKENPENFRIYTYNLTRPRDETKILNKTGGIQPEFDGRELSGIKYLGQKEGTVFKVSDEGELVLNNGKYDTGISNTHLNYKLFIYENDSPLKLTLKGGTQYVHIRYSFDDKANWTEIESGEQTAAVPLTETEFKVYVETVDDKAYVENGASEVDLFEGATLYTITVQKANIDKSTVSIVSASSLTGDWYPEFSPENATYLITVPNGGKALNVTFTLTSGATAKSGNTVLSSDENGNYTIEVKSTQTKITVVSADGSLENEYAFSIMAKSAYKVPDRVVDFLCINSQYTNGLGFGNGASPWVSLKGTLTSLGNFGGYITYYYDTPIVNDPKNKFGIDFYVYGNANVDSSTSTGMSFFEPGQIWVSEDNNTWYALAGSAHYDDGVEWNYTVNYQKASNGKTKWTDSLGNANDGASYSGQWPLKSKYFLNSLIGSDTVTLSGICLPSANGNIFELGTAVDCYPVNWGYSDAFSNGEIGKDVNPYLDNSDHKLRANGFDLEWAVDKDGNIVDVSNKAFHYIKVQTASNIWHPSFAEKSTEVSYVVVTTPQETEVSRTSPVSGITVSDGVDAKSFNFTGDKNSYEFNIGDIKYVSLSVNGAAEDDNIYVNNQRIAHDGKSDIFKVIKGQEKLVRIVIQNGDKEPRIYLVKLTGTSQESDKLIENIKVDVSGIARKTETTDGENYKTSVGYRIDSVKIVPIADKTVDIKVNGEPISDSYELAEGQNEFAITGEKDGIIQTLKLVITRDAVPASTGKIKVLFSLYGDTAHGEDDENVHTLRDGNLQRWISNELCELDAPATVLDVIIKALDGKYSFVNPSGNYITTIEDIGEFTNGLKSGWMYTLNGSHPTKGVKEQSVKNGDVIVLHYTDDYTVEEGSEKWARRDNTATEVTYKVEFNTNGGSKLKSQTVKDGEKVSEPSVPQKEGYIFKGWYIDNDFTKVYDFTKKVTSDLTLYAKWEKEKTEETEIEPIKFTDVKKDDWFYNAVEFVKQKGIMNGVSETEFEPEAKLTRAMFITVLYSLENKPKTGDVSFSDIKTNDWFYNAVSWGAENGIVSGVSDTIFDPDSDITREQLSVMLYRYYKFKGYDLSSTGKNISEYNDSQEISDYAKDALSYISGIGLIKGKSDTTINPLDNATRAETAMIIMRMFDLLKLTK